MQSYCIPETARLVLLMQLCVIQFHPALIIERLSSVLAQRLAYQMAM